MKVVVAMDSFKGSLDSLAAGEAVRAGILRAVPDARVCMRPLADGGEGTVEALARGMGGRIEHAPVTGPLGGRVDCACGVLPDGAAVIEVAGAAGLTLVPEEARDPLRATTFGVGEVIRRAMERGCRRFIVGLGGSATNDGGAGMLQALGFDLLDEVGRQIPPGAAGLERLAQIGDGRVPPELGDCRFRAACDVANPLCGARGASAVFGPQKGATPEMVRRMDAALARFARLAARARPAADPELPGAGAAGGLGFALSAFLSATLEPGAGIVIEETGLEERVREADVVVTGEGRLDGQTAMGKAPIAVARLAGEYGKPALALCGCAAENARACNGAGIDAYFPILPGAMTLSEAMDPANARANLAAAAEQVFRLIARVRG